MTSFFLLIQAALPSAGAVNVPSSETAGAEEARFQERQDLLERKKETVPETLLEAASERDKKTVRYDGPNFRMNDIRITGNELIPTKELEPFIWPLLNRDVNLGEIQETAAEIQRYYQSKGYVATYVYVPPQKIEQGVVELRIAEGRLAEIEISGNRWFSTPLIESRLPAARGGAIDYGKLRRDLTRLNKHPDLEARAVLKPGPEPGTTRVLVDVKDRLPVHAGVDVSNLGTENTGKTRWGQTLALTNLTGRLDPLSGRFEIGRGAYAVGADYNVPIAATETRAGISYSRASVDVGGPFKALGLEGEATTYGAYLLTPFWERERWETSLRFGFDWKSVENRILGETAGEDELRIFSAALNFSEVDRFGKTLMINSFHFGVNDFLGASSTHDRNATRTGSSGQFFAHRLSLLRKFAMPASMTLALRLIAQFTPDTLAPSEQIKLGGAHSVRGYPEGDYYADSGAHASAEILVPTYFFPKDWKLPRSSTPLREQIQGVVFFDFGGGALHRPMPGEDENRFLAGAGGGVRVRIHKNLFGRFEWAAPVGAEALNNQHSAFYFGVALEA